MSVFYKNINIRDSIKNIKPQGDKHLQTVKKNTKSLLLASTQSDNTVTKIQ